MGPVACVRVRLAWVARDAARRGAAVSSARVALSVDGARGAFRYRLGWPVFVPSTSDAFLFVNAFYKHNEALIP